MLPISVLKQVAEILLIGNRGEITFAYPDAGSGEDI